MKHKTSVSSRLLDNATIELNERKSEKMKLRCQIEHLQNEIEKWVRYWNIIDHKMPAETCAPNLSN